MKKITLYFFALLLTAFAGQATAERFWWASGTSAKNNDFMQIFFEENKPLWETSRGRISGWTLRRESAVAVAGERSANSPAWQAMQAFVPTWDVEYAMNSGAMNKSWEKEPSGQAEKLRKGDLAAVQNLAEAGAQRITLFMQSPLSKGNKSTFKDGPKGASIATRIEDMKRYINWMEARRPAHVQMSYALIDAHPAKNILDPDGYKQAYREMAQAFKDDNMPFVGIMFDWKATTLSVAGAAELVDACKWVETDLSDEMGIDYYAGWWVWYFINGVPKETLFERAVRGYNRLMDVPDNHWVKHVLIDGALGMSGGPTLPDTVDGFPMARLEGLNHAYEILEPRIADNLTAQLQGLDSVLLNWEVEPGSDTDLIVQRKEGGGEFVDIAQLTTTDTSYLDITVIGGETYTYRIFAPEANIGQEYSNEVSIRAPDVIVEYRNQNTNAQDNFIGPQFRLKNIGGFDRNYEDLTVRYWFTSENHNDLIFTTDWAALGVQNINASFTALEPALINANYSADVTFAAGSLAGNSDSGEIHNRIYKVDWTTFDENNDHSYGANQSYEMTDKITVYLNGELIWGVEPQPQPGLVSELVVQQKNPSAGLSEGNTIFAMLQVDNVGPVAVPYSDLSVRYWFSSEDGNNVGLNHWIDWAELGAGAVSGEFKDTVIGTVGTDKYLELSFSLDGQSLSSLSSTGEIHTRIGKTDWSNFELSNDHSYNATSGWTEGVSVTAYIGDQLVWGTEPEVIPIPAPFTDDGLPWSVGEVIQAEDFDTTINGVLGQGVNYLEDEVRVGDLTIRPDELVDVFSKNENNGNPVVNIGAVGEGEWWAYTVEIPAGDYTVTFRTSSKVVGDRTVSFRLGNDTALTVITFPPSGDWKDYEEHETAAFTVAESGVYQFIVQSDSGGTDLDRFVINPQGQAE